MILHYPLESGSSQSDSNQTRTTEYQLSCGVTSAHTEHHSCVNGVNIVIATCSQASCNLIELQKRKTHDSNQKQSTSWEKSKVKQEALQSYQRVSRKKQQCFHSLCSLPLLILPSLNYIPIRPTSEWYSLVWNACHV